MIHLKFKEISGKLPTSVFDIIDGEKIVGFVQVRHNLSAGLGVPQECASHIYCEVNEGERGKGYGKEALKLAIKEAKNIGLNVVVATCEENNIASKRVIEANGGLYTTSCTCEDGKEMLRYEFRLSK